MNADKPEGGAAPGIIHGGGATRDRRRPGRLAIDNEHLIGLLRAPGADPDKDAADPVAGMPPEDAGGKGKLAYVIIAAVLLWCAIVAAVWLL